MMKRIVKILVVLGIPIIRWALTKALQMVTEVILSNTFCSLGIRPIVLLAVLQTFRRCSSNVSFKSKITPKCFCELV